VNPNIAGAVICGGLAAGALAWILLSVLIPARVSLHQALSLDRSIATFAVRDEEAARAVTSERSGRLTGFGVRIEAWLSARNFTTPDSDLTLIEWTRGRFLLVRIALAALALLAGPIFAMMVAVGGGSITYAVPQAVSLFLAAGVWYGTGVWVKGQAEQRRLEMREALVSFLTILALFKASGEAMNSALQQAARVSDAWTFRRIDARLSASFRAGASPQDGLEQLGKELGIDELSDVAEITATANLEGAAVFTTLLARADALRNEMQAESEANASANSVRLGIPKALLVMTGVAFMMYPLIVGISGS